MQPKTRHITTMADIANLTPDEFERFLPDLILWHNMATEAKKRIGDVLNEQTLQWTDDGQVECNELTLEFSDTENTITADQLRSIPLIQPA